MYLSTCSLTKGFPVHFVTSEEPTFALQAQKITECVWSHITWSGGTRGEEFFTCSDYLALDFDEGPGINEFVAKAKDFSFAIGPSKSHGIPKGDKPACDRFRVLIPWEDTIWDLDLFRWNMKKAITYFGADPATYDAARCWQPSKYIHLVQDGAGWPIDHEIPEEETLEYRQKLRDQRANYFRETKSLPRATRMFLLQGPFPGESWNKALFLSALTLLEYGHSSEKVRDLCKRVPGIGTMEKFETTLKSACRRAGVEYF